MSTQILRYSLVFLINSMIERGDETFKNNSDSVVTVILNERSQTIHIEVRYARLSDRHHKPGTEDKSPHAVSDRA